MGISCVEWNVIHLIDVFNYAFYIYKKTGTEPNKYEKPLIPLKRSGTIDIRDGYLYRILKKHKDKTYLKCCMVKEFSCKASYVLEKASNEIGMDTYRCLATHNHPANELTVQSTRFMNDLERAVQRLPGTTKDIFNHVIERYPDVKQLYTYSNVIGRMHHWLKKYRRQKNIIAKPALESIMLNGAQRRSTYHGGYTYGMYSSSTSSKIYLRCSGHRSTGCRGRGYILRGQDVESFVLLDEHCHPPNFLLERRSEIAKTMKEYALSVPGKPIEIYNSVVSIYPEVRQIWPFSRAVRTINRVRQQSGFMRN